MNAALLFSVTLLSRYLTRSSLYFADGPRLVDVIRSGTFVIQPPGYWLYAHLGALLPDPAAGLAMWNALFCASGVSVFYLLCRRRSACIELAFLAALAYDSVYFSWFGSVTHSSYPSQLLFPPLIVYCFLRFSEFPTPSWLVGCGIAIGVEFGLRPTDGIFLTPLWIYLGATCIRSVRLRLLLIAITTVVCAAWYIPTRRALAAYPYGVTGSWIGAVAHSGASVFMGINAHSAANWVRVLLPLFAAFGMLIPVISSRHKRGDGILLLLWIAPGLLFLFLFYMSDAPYLTYLTGGILLAAVGAPNRKFAGLCLCGCFLWNTTLFLTAKPVRVSGAMTRAIDFYVVKYCWYGIRHQWMSTYGRNGRVPLD